MKTYIAQACRVVCFLCILYTIISISDYYRHEQDIRALLEQKQAGSFESVDEIVRREQEKALELEKERLRAVEEERQKARELEENSRVKQPPAILLPYRELAERNPDMIGWLAIPGMKIDYPVVQGPDDEYYLSHNFDGEKDKYGCLFIKSSADPEAGNTNVTVYGHNMKDGSMFGDLDKYRSETFMREHSIIKFDTLYEKRTYQIVSVFLSRIYRKNQEVFKYYQFSQAENEEEFREFYENIKKLSLYDTGVSADYKDSFLTLSTCTYHVDYGRLVVVAKRIE